MNPYETSDIPPSDRYVNEPLFGRYERKPSDFRLDLKLLLSKSPEVPNYLADILSRCTLQTRVAPGIEGARDVFAIGSIIVKSNHLQEAAFHRDFSWVDKNEVQAIEKVRLPLGRLGVYVPEVYFSSKVMGSDVLIQSRIPGVVLCVAWQYLSESQKCSFKIQTRQIIRELHKLKPKFEQSSYVFPDHDPLAHRDITPLEHEILFSQHSDLGLVHNDLNAGNIVVNHDGIVGLIDWEMAGYFNLEAASNVHKRFRGPRREDFINVNLPEEELADVLYWNDLYDV